MKNINWFKNKGVPDDNLNDAEFSYFKSLSTLDVGSVVDHISDVLTQLGYTVGTISDRLLLFYRDQTGLSTASFPVAETAFYSDNSLGFGAGSGGLGGEDFILMEDGNKLLLENGSKLLLEISNSFDILLESGSRLLTEAGDLLLLET